MADDKKAGTSELALEIAKALKEGIKEGLEVGQAYAARQVADSRRRTVVNESTGAQCPDCKQPVFTLTGPACKGKHRKAVVFPRFSPEFFNGVGINGVWYKSNSYGHAITIPEDSNIEDELRRWDDNEESMKTQRKRQVQDYNSNFMKRSH